MLHWLVGDGVDGLFWHLITVEDLRLIASLSLAVQENVGGIQYFCIGGIGTDHLNIIYLCILLQSHCAHM